MRTFYERCSATDGEKALNDILETALTATEPTYIGSMVITADDWNVGKTVGEARAAIANERGIKGRTFERPVQATGMTVDTEGATGDYLSQVLLDKAPGVAVAPLVEYKAFGDKCDIYVNGTIAIEVKTTNWTKDAVVNINAKQHTKKKPSIYVVIRYVSLELADIYVLPMVQEDQPVPESWKYKTGYTPFYAVKMPEVMAIDKEAA